MRHELHPNAVQDKRKMDAGLLLILNEKQLNLEIVCTQMIDSICKLFYKIINVSILLSHPDLSSKKCGLVPYSLGRVSSNKLNLLRFSYKFYTCSYLR